jgi:hypothetical protein
VNKESICDRLWRICWRINRCFVPCLKKPDICQAHTSNRLAHVRTRIWAAATMHLKSQRGMALLAHHRMWAKRHGSYVCGWICIQVHSIPERTWWWRTLKILLWQRPNILWYYCLIMQKSVCYYSRAAKFNQREMVVYLNYHMLGQPVYIYFNNSC